MEKLQIMRIPQSAHNELPNTFFEAADLLGNHDHSIVSDNCEPKPSAKRRLTDEDDFL